ncbi:amino acid adenylation domain-containing protein [Streptomyces sp. NPDC051940]|uniref:amino acid adenylation domain-containing protein n=1 Tax=Streptomyces sp. NPDC051940 TaxID=3155675 RepID=UPI00342B7BD5
MESSAREDIVGAFCRTAARYPQRPAVVHNGRQLGYAELLARVRATAHRLGSDPGVTGVLTSRSAAVVSAMLGILAAGGTYLPVDPAHPLPRRREVLDLSGCRTVIGPEPDAPPDHDGLRGPVPVPADHPAYILFTSGSTGRPKPVVTPRGAISTVTAALRELFGLAPEDRVLQFASLNWDTCFEEILPALTAGAALVFHDDAYAGSFPRLLRMIDEQRVTVLDLPTAFWHELVLHLVEERGTLPPSVRLVVIGGEAVNPSRLADWRALDTGGIRLLNTYGCTETTLITHAVDLHGPFAPTAPADRVPIGHPLPHVRERVTGDGELLIGGPALASGYRGLAAATAERFVELDGERWFRTGDRVSRAAGGALVHEGRLDHELKVRGIRVDPGEVEAQIAGHPRVRAVAVAGVTVAGRTVLAAYVVPRPQDDTSTLAGDVLAYLRTRVPGHLVPGRITVVPRLVHTAGGKVDRGRLDELIA